MRHPVTAIQPNGKAYQISRAEAESLVASGAHIVSRTARHKVKVIKICPRLIIRGMSARYGAELAMRIREKNEIALVMLEHIRHRGHAPEDHSLESAA